MGTDNLHHKRKAKKTKDHQRRIASRQPYDRVLIVCEGQKTEPFYFEELRKYYNLHSTNIKITGNCDSSPTSILKKAEELDKFAPEKELALVFGNEGKGMREEIIKECDSLIKIPMNTFESLNVAVAAGIIAYHFRKNN